MNYYLADGKIELREIKESNSGKDPFPLLLKKSNVPVEPIFTYCPGLETKKEEYYSPKDLVIGNYVNVYGRPCLIYNCDDFTRKWYKESYGVDMIPITKYGKLQTKIIHPIPPHTTGIGSEEDSLLSVFHLRPVAKHPHTDKMFKSDKHILRFSAKLISQTPSDSERKFIVSFFVKDSTILVFEAAEKNSGRISSKFMERKKHKNPYTNKYYTETDFKFGSAIYISKYTFRLLECDDYTTKYMKDNPEMFVDSDVVAVVERIRKASMKYNSLEEFGVDLLSKLDPKGTGYASKIAIQNALKEFNVFLSSQEMVTLDDTLRHDENGNMSMEDFYNLVIHS